MSNTVTKLLATCAITLAMTTAAQADKFVYGSWFGANHTVNTLGLAPYFDLLATQSDGAIEWDLVAGAQLASGPGTPEAVGGGLMDGGIAIAPYQPRLLPATNLIFSNSLLGTDTLAAAGAMNETIMLGCPQCQQEYHASNAVGFAGYAASPYVFMCSTEVTTIDDLAGLKVRASGGGVSITTIAGATPVSMSPAEATTAIERGTLDCVLGSVSWLRSYSYMDVVKTVVDSPMGNGGPPILMFLNRDVWNAMTPEMRALHIKLAPDLVAGASYDAQILTDGTIIEAAKAAGVTFTPDNDGFAAIMVEHDSNQRAQVLATATDSGVENPAELLDTYLAAYERWQDLLDAQGHDRETFRRLLWEEVYAKVDPDAL